MNRNVMLKEVRVYTNNGANLTTIRYKYDESGTGLMSEREVVGGSKVRFHWEGQNIYLEEEYIDDEWVAVRAGYRGAKGKNAVYFPLENPSRINLYPTGVPPPSTPSPNILWYTILKAVKTFRPVGE